MNYRHNKIKAYGPTVVYKITFLPETEKDARLLNKAVSIKYSQKEVQHITKMLDEIIQKINPNLTLVEHLQQLNDKYEIVVKTYNN